MANSMIFVSKIPNSQSKQFSPKTVEQSIAECFEDQKPKPKIDNVYITLTLRI